MLRARARVGAAVRTGALIISTDSVSIVVIVCRIYDPIDTIRPLLFSHNAFFTYPSIRK
jgi:hypothetical protein